MEKKQKYIKNLNEKIFFICYVKSCYKEEIAELLYGENSDAYATLVGKNSGRVKELVDKKWLSKVEPKDVYKPSWWKEEKIDGRAWRRQYYHARPDPLISKIEEKIKLTDFDKRALKNIFNSRKFREMTCDSEQIFNVVVKEDIITPLDYILIQLEHWAMVYLKNKYLSAIGNKIVDQKIYDFLTTGYRKLVEKQDINRYKTKLKEFFPSQYEEMSKLKTSEELCKKLEGIEYLIFLPSDLLKRLIGVSFFGLLDAIFTSINNEAKELGNVICKAWPNVSSKVENDTFK